MDSNNGLDANLAVLTAEKRIIVNQIENFQQFLLFETDDTRALIVKFVIRNYLLPELQTDLQVKTHNSNLENRN